MNKSVLYQIYEHICIFILQRMSAFLRLHLDYTIFNVSVSSDISTKDPNSANLFGIIFQWDTRVVDAQWKRYVTHAFDFSNKTIR